MSAHHLANDVLRSFNALGPEAVLVDVEFIAKTLKVHTVQEPGERIDLYRVRMAYAIASVTVKDEDAYAFVCALLAPLWAVEPVVVYGKLTFQRMCEAFIVPEHVMLTQLRKLA